MKTEIATTKEQSRRLLACGVSADTADMVHRDFPEDWHDGRVWHHWHIQALSYSNATMLFDSDKIEPAWSLSSLLSLLPKEIKIDGYAYRISIYFESPEEPVIGNQWCLYYKPVKYTEKSRIDDVAMYAENLIECAVLMAEYLYEHGYKLNENKE